MNEKKAVFYVPQGSQDTTPPKFAEMYEQVSRLEYDMFSVDGAKEFRGKAPSRRCCLCDRDDKDTTFKAEAHLIPAFLGNRRFFTLEECDECNGAYGSDCEHELAKMTEPYRAFNNVPRRKGLPPPIWGKGSDSPPPKSSRDPSKVSIQIGGSVGIQIDEANRTMKVTGPAPAYCPGDAIKSLLKSAWFCLSHDQRLKHEYLRQIIKDQLIIEPLVFFDGFNPAADRKTCALQIWQSKTNDQDSCNLIVGLRIGVQILLWCSPDLKMKKYESNVIPPISGDIDSPPKLDRRIVESLKKEIFPKDASFHISFSSIKEGPSEEGDISATVADRPSLKGTVSLYAEVGNEWIEIKPSYLKTRYEKTKNAEMVIGGGAFGAEMVMPLAAVANANDKGPLDCKFRFTLKLDTIKVPEALQTIEFLKMLCDPQGSVEIRMESGSVFRLGNADSHDDLDFNLFKEVLYRIKTVNSFLGSEHRYPRRTEVGYTNDLNFMFLAVSRGIVYFPTQAGKITAMMPKEQAVNLPNSVTKEGKFSIVHPEMSHKFDGCVYNLGETQVSLDEAKILVSKCENHADNVEVKIDFVGISYQFKRYMK